MKMWYYLWSPLMITFSFYFMEYRHPLPALQDNHCVSGVSCIGIWDCVLVYAVSEFVFLCKLNSDLNSCFFFFFWMKKKSLLLALLLYTVKVTTDNFFDANKLGEGGFGVVYKVNVTLLLTSKGMI